MRASAAGNVPSLNLPPEWLAAIVLIVVAAYVVYGLTGFGSGVIAMPLLALLLPFKLAVTLLMLLDIVAGAVLVGKHHRGIRYAELTIVIPFMLIGLVLGVFLLLELPERPLLFGLGILIVGYALFALVRRDATPVIGKGWGAILSTLGGALIALYNVGGVLWVTYAASRIHEKEQLRSTIASTLLISVVGRALLYGKVGLLDDPEVWLAAGVLVLPTLIGYYAGSLLHAKVSLEGFLKAVYLVMLGAGTALVLRTI